MVLITTLLVVNFSLLVVPPDTSDHEYSTILLVEKPNVIRNLLNFEVETLAGNEIKILDRFEKEGYPKLVILSFMAEWCKNCNYEASFLGDIYRSWHNKGLEMLVIAEYSEPRKFELFVKRHSLPMPWYLGQVRLKDKEKRESTMHYRLRSVLMDKRGWGTPFHILIAGGDGSKVYFVNGEFKESDLIFFLNEYLVETATTRD